MIAACESVDMFDPEEVVPEFCRLPVHGERPWQSRQDRRDRRYPRQHKQITPTPLPRQPRRQHHDRKCHGEESLDEKGCAAGNACRDHPPKTCATARPPAKVKTHDRRCNGRRKRRVEYRSCPQNDWLKAGCKHQSRECRKIPSIGPPADKEHQHHDCQTRHECRWQPQRKGVLTEPEK